MAVRLLILALALALSGCAAPTAGGRQPSYAAYFSPGGGCTQHIVTAIRSARESVLVQAYSFTSEPIAQALLEASRRGVDVRILVDKSQLKERYTVADDLLREGVLVMVDSAHAIAHDKVMVIDGATVLTGSFNFTKSAEERNAENLLVAQDRALADRYTDNWETHRRHAKPYGAVWP